MTTKNSTAFKYYKYSYEYEFESKNVWNTSTQLTQVFPLIRIWFEPYRNAFDSTYIQPSPYKKHMQTWTHMHTDSHAHKYIYKLAYAQPSSYIKNMWNITHTRTDSQTHIYTYELKNTLHLISSSTFITCSWLYVYPKTLNITLTLTLAARFTCIKNPNPNPNKKCTKNHAN